MIPCSLYLFLLPFIGEAMEYFCKCKKSVKKCAEMQRFDIVSVQSKMMVKF